MTKTWLSITFLLFAWQVHSQTPCKIPFSKPVHSVALGGGLYMYTGRALMCPAAENKVRQFAILTPKLVTNLDSSGNMIPELENPTINVTISSPQIPGPAVSMYLYGVTVNNTAFTKNTEIAISAETNPAISVKYDYYCDYMIIGKIKEK